MRSPFRPEPALSALLIALLACSGPGGAPAPASPPGLAARAEPAARAAADPLQALIEGARREGTLTLVWSGIDDAATVQRLAAGFNRAYGLNLQVQFTPGPGMPTMASRLAQEYLAGRPATTDVFIGSETHIVSLLEADALEPVAWAEWSRHVRDPRLIAPNGVAVKLASRSPGITYNTARVTGDAVPRTLQDLLQPRYKGRVASTPYAATFNRLASPEVWGEQRTLEYTTRFAEQVIGLIRCGEVQRVATGEFDLFALDCGVEYRKLQAEGQPIAQVIPADAPLLVYWYVAVPRHAVHPNAAKLWVDYLLGREAQDIIYESELADNHLVPGSKSGGGIAALEAQGVRFIDIDVAFAQRTDEKWLAEITRQLQQILQK